MARPYTIDVTTSTTASSTTFPEGFHLLSCSNLDGTNNILVSFDATIGTTDNPESTLTPTNDTLSFNNINQIFPVEEIFWDANAGSPILRCVGFIA